MKFWKNKNPNPLPIENPSISFTLSDNLNLEIGIYWPEDCKFNNFVALLRAINSGDLIEAIIAESYVYAEKINQVDKAIFLHKNLEKIQKNKAEEDDDSPAVLPSQVFGLQMKAFHNNGN